LDEPFRLSVIFTNQVRTCPRVTRKLSTRLERLASDERFNLFELFIKTLITLTSVAILKKKTFDVMMSFGLTSVKIIWKYPDGGKNYAEKKFYNIDTRSLPAQNEEENNRQDATVT
jgi:hypothetical protein